MSNNVYFSSFINDKLHLAKKCTGKLKISQTTNSELIQFLLYTDAISNFIFLSSCFV